MTTELTAEVTGRLEFDRSAWLTTVAKSGQPVPRLVWFYFDGTDVVVYTMPEAGKVRHIKNNPLVSLNLDSDGKDRGVIVVGGPARIDATGIDMREDGPFWAKYQTFAEEMGITDILDEYHMRLKISIEKVWTTPPEALL
ncbi:TIGR03667 family PPOX class F420-dependent oxidoreductase [Mycolicibacterium baixiangningiae]|uniref:TIGR03667 family PPOX class F420-dependent oxidoreductase n=1 Tax=Mycolicibacterium baixiangningiae TaxID=2761578 RepID=UPI0018D05775|nr:TIGR03667 family PPOX class F420-dependent oxidoreductase [Mycolicibacterium baixiangningiae]